MSNTELGLLIVGLTIFVLAVSFTGFWFFNRFLLKEKAKAERFRGVHSGSENPPGE